MCLLKPFVLKNTNLGAHLRWIMHSMQKNMHFLNTAVSLSAVWNIRNVDYRRNAERVPVVRAALKQQKLTKPDGVLKECRWR